MTAPTKADAAAADRLLKAAVRRAVEMLREPSPPIRYVLGATPVGSLTFAPSTILAFHDEPDHDPVVAMFTAACVAADLLLEAS